MTQLILVRHGETAWNTKRLVQGQGDPPLSAEGKKQVEMLSERFRTYPVNAIYSSDLKRALQTAEKIAAVTGLSVNPSRDIRELCFGDW